MNTAAQLELSDDCLSRPLPADLITLGAHMLWPGEKDTDERESAIRSGHLNILISDWQIPQEFAKQIASDALDALPMKTIQESAQARRTKGYIAGVILRHVISEVALDRMSEKAQVSWIIDELFSKPPKKGAPRRQRPRTIENTVWKDFRKVSHFWASYEETFDAADLSSFPCKLENLCNFLSISEAFRTQGEATNPWKPAECVTSVTGVTAWAPSPIRMHAAHITDVTDVTRPSGNGDEDRHSNRHKCGIAAGAERPSRSLTAASCLICIANVSIHG